VKRYEIGGYDRELHGALLDSQILGDVYLSMTGGQSALNFSDTNDENSSIAGQGNNKEPLDLNLRVIELSDEEKNAHKEYLLRMKDETGTDPIGLN
jgi:DNA polymerase-3 subunit epsilon